MPQLEEASPICRGKNLSWDTILLFYNSMPQEAMPKAQFHAITESKINGWSQTHSQIARQLAFYYEEDGVCYPRFTKETSYADLFSYMQNWAAKYFIPNPYAPSLKDFAPTCIYASVVEALKSGQSDFDTIIDSIFDVQLSSHDKVKVYLSNFTDLVFDKKTVSINNRTMGIDTILHPDSEFATDTKKYFEYFGIPAKVIANSSRGLIQSQPLQQIFYGAPGTGKSHCIKDLIKDNDNIVRTTFHPDSDYSTFVGSYKPTTKQVPMRDVTGKVIKENGQDVTEDRIIYEFVNQAFLQAYINAWKLYAQCTEGEPEKQYLVIEEINRGNCAQIFGDLFQLLDRNYAGFSEYPIKADADMKNQLAKAFNGIDILDRESINQYFNGKDVVEKVLKGEELVLPNNLYIWATMNTSDQSLFPIDSAFKRRWDWQYMPITNGKKGWKIVVNGLRYDWWDFLEKINEQINATTNSEDKKMGYFFCKAKDGIIDAKTFVGKVVFYVWNDVFKDFANEAGNLFIDEDGTLLTFSKFYRVVNGKTEVLENKVERLLNNLGVFAEGETIDVEEFEKDVPANSSKNYLKEIVFPDGTIYSTSEMTHFDAYMAAIRKIGVEKVASVADKLKYRRLNRPLISAEKYDEIENSAGFSYQQEGNYYFVKGVMTYTLVRILEDLDEMLNVGMTINN